MSAILKFGFQKRKQLRFSEVNYLSYTKKTEFSKFFHVTTTFSPKQGETRTNSVPIPHPLRKVAGNLKSQALSMLSKTLKVYATAQRILAAADKLPVKWYFNISNSNGNMEELKGTNGRQKTYEIFHVYCIFYSGFMCQTTLIFGITKDGSLVLNTLSS